jgi:N-acetylglucosaminyldiphosphoundecaprenol N-acetyl-beta-D-mannosaminyltransferase
MKKSVELFGLVFHNLEINDLSRNINSGSDFGGVGYHLINSFTLVEASKSTLLQEMLEHDISICDGKPLAQLLRLKDRTFRQIRGADLMRNVLLQSPSGTKHFFLGSSEAVVQKLILSVKKFNPLLEVCGYHSPPYQDDLSPLYKDWAAMIIHSQANVVWVGLGTPKQDYVTFELAKKVNANVLAVGAAFDYLAGTTTEAPKIVQVLGLEWLYRLLSEPRRLSYRYLFGNSKFCLLVFKEFIIRR